MDPVTAFAAYNAGVEGLKQTLQVGQDIAEVAEGAYNVKAAKEKLLNMAKPEYTVKLRLTNSTPITWTLPQAYIKQGTADRNPPLRVGPKGTIEWKVNSYILVGTGVEGVLCYTVAPGKALVVLFRVKRVSVLRMKNLWSADIIDTTKKNVQKIKVRKKMHQRLLKLKHRHRGDCCTYDKIFSDEDKPFYVIGGMANSETPQLVVHVREKSSKAFSRSLSAPQMTNPVKPRRRKKSKSSKKTYTVNEENSQEMHSVDDPLGATETSAPVQAEVDQEQTVSACKPKTYGRSMSDSQVSIESKSRKPPKVPKRKRRSTQLEDRQPIKTTVQTSSEQSPATSPDCQLGAESAMQRSMPKTFPTFSRMYLPSKEND
eukprot:m.23461 g.23461  ORF g.23461 m.23461 type:complete len:372 (+) comp28482_c0_seq1:1777-2892(+)